MKTRFLAVVSILFVAIHAHAGGVSCATATSLVADGRLLDFDNVQPSSSNWYQFTATAGRSYSVEVRDDVDGNNPDLTVTYYGPNSTCSSLVSIPTSIASITDTHATEPALPASGSRSSIVTCPTANFVSPCTASGAGTYLIKVANGSSTASHYVSIGVTETTIYGSTWNASMNTQFLMQNTSSQSIAYTFTLSATAGGTQTYTTSGTLGAVATSTSLLNWATAGTITPGQLGIAIFAHNGPPGAIQALEWWYNYSTNPITLMPVPIGPIRGK